MRQHRERAGIRNQQGVAIRRRAGAEFGRHQPAGAGTVVRDDGLADEFGQLDTDDARGIIRRAAGRKRNQYAHRLHRIRLRRRQQGRQREQARDAYGDFETAASFHARHRRFLPVHDSSRQSPV